jgi:hypothetical protein
MRLYRVWLTTPVNAFEAGDTEFTLRIDPERGKHAYINAAGMDVLEGVFKDALTSVELLGITNTIEVIEDEDEPSMIDESLEKYVI